MTTSNQQATSFQTVPVLARLSAGPQATAAKVVISDAGIEIHGYLIAREGSQVHVVWAVASGRHRHRTFPAEAVSLPCDDRRWGGYPIPAERLAVMDRAELRARRR